MLWGPRLGNPCLIRTLTEPAHGELAKGVAELSQLKRFANGPFEVSIGLGSYPSGMAGSAPWIRLGVSRNRPIADSYQKIPGITCYIDCAA